MLQKNLIFFRQPPSKNYFSKFHKYSFIKRVSNWQNLLTVQSIYLKECYPNAYTFFFNISTNLRTSVPLLASSRTNLKDVGSRQLCFYKYFYNGLGYKVFCKNNYLFVWVGLTHYTLLKIPSYIKIFAKKRRFFILGTNRLKFNAFLTKIRQIRRIDLYKGKGITEIKSYKTFIKMKSGKKKQY